MGTRARDIGVSGTRVRGAGVRDTWCGVLGQRCWGWGAVA